MLLHLMLSFVNWFMLCGIGLAVVIVPILFITCLPQTFSFSWSCLNAGDKMKSNLVHF